MPLLNSPEMAAAGNEVALVVGDPPAFSVWRMVVETDDGKPLRLWYFKTEGGAMTREDRERLFEFYEEGILSGKENYIQFFDLEKGFEGAASHAMALATFCRSIRERQRDLLVQTLLVCRDTGTRAALRMVFSLSPPCKPLRICDTVAEAYEAVLDTTDTGNWRSL